MSRDRYRGQVSELRHQSVHHVDITYTVRIYKSYRTATLKIRVRITITSEFLNKINFKLELLIGFKLALYYVKSTYYILNLTPKTRFVLREQKHVNTPRTKTSVVSKPFIPMQDPTKLIVGNIRFGTKVNVNDHLLSDQVTSDLQLQYNGRISIPTLNASLHRSQQR